MSIIVVVQDYPAPNRQYAMAYVHTRSMEYARLGVTVDVLSFTCSQAYSHEGIRVFPEQAVDLSRYDTIICHAPNLRNHWRLLRDIKGKRLVFCFHGHEVLKSVGDYPAEYDWKRDWKKTALNIAYDRFKLPAMAYFLKRMGRNNSVRMIFVSDWMRRMFEKNLKMAADYIGPWSIIPNTSHRVFVSQSYDAQPGHDFITIRPLDYSKYAIDLVVRLALANPNLSFHIYGEGQYFQYNAKPENITHFAHFIPQQEIPQLLNGYKAALMPTRFDAQGVMMCEMATFGIPVVTTDIEITREVLSAYSESYLLTEEKFDDPLSVEEIYKINIGEKFLQFSPDHVMTEELAFING